MALKIQEIAAQLLENQQAQDHIKETLVPLLEDEDRLREAMVDALKKSRIPSFRSEATGHTYTRAFRASLGITDEAKALKWAIKNKCAKVDTSSANKLLKGSGALPEGFEQRETEYLTINKPKQ